MVAQGPAPLARSCLEKQLSWQTDIPADLPEISADPNRLASIVENLVSNAIKYTHNGGKVSISAVVEGEELFDQGKG